MADKGAKYVLEIDGCNPMIQADNVLKIKGIEYCPGNVQDMGSLVDASLAFRILLYMN